MENKTIFETDVVLTEVSDETLKELPKFEFDIFLDKSSILSGGIAALIKVHKMDSVSLKKGALIISCTVVDSAGKVVHEQKILTDDFTTKPIKNEYEKSIPKQIGPIRLQKGSYKLNIYAQYAVIGFLGGYCLLTSGIQLLKDGQLFKQEAYEPSRATPIGEIKKTVILEA